MLEPEQFKTLRAFFFAVAIVVAALFISEANITISVDYLNIPMEDTAELDDETPTTDLKVKL